MGKKKKNNGKRGGNRFFRWMRSDLPDDEDKKSPVLLLGVNKIVDSPSFARRRSIEGSHGSGSIRFFRPPKSKYTRGFHGDERLEKIRQDLLTHKSRENYIPSTSKGHESIGKIEEKEKVACLKLNCVGTCKACENKSSSNRGSFLFHRPDNRQSSLCPSEPYGAPEQGQKIDYSENEIEFKYTEHIPAAQHAGSSKQNSYNVTPKSTERRHFLLTNLNERFRKTLSLDSRKVDRLPLSLPQESRPKSLVNTSNILSQSYTAEEAFSTPNFDKPNPQRKKKFRPKSFFSLETFFDSKRSDSSSVDDHSSSKYKKFELESDDSPLFRRDVNTPRSSQRREKTPDLLNLPIIIDSVRKKQSNPKRQLEKLESHYYKSVGRTVIDAVPKDATDQLQLLQGPSGHTNHLLFDDDDVEYIEPIRSNFTSQSTLILDSKNIPQDCSLKLDSLLTINTDETDIKLPSSTVSPKSNAEVCAQLENDIDSIGAYEIEVKETDLINNRSKDLVVKVMDKSMDSIGSCSLDVDASTDFSDTTSGSLNLLTPSSTTSRIRDFTSRLQERAASASVQPHNRHLLAQASLNPSPINAASPARTPDNARIKDHHHQRPSDHLLRPPPPKLIVNDSTSHRSRGYHKRRDEVAQKKPSYLNLACSVNGYTNLTTYDSKLRQDINRSREASPIRPITHQCRAEYNHSLVVPIPVSANKLLVPKFEPHDTARGDLTTRAPVKAHTDPYLATSPLHVFMAAENKQLKNDFLGANMTTAARPYVSTESKTFASSMIHRSDEVDNAKEISFKSSYSETNFASKTVANGQKNEAKYMSSESYTIHSSNGVSKRVEITKENGETLTSPMKSFIQQRVERLYGPGALAQGFFNQKRHKVKSHSDEEDSDAKVLTEKPLNYRTDNFNKSYSPKRNSNVFEQNENVYSSPNGESDPNLSLPVLRHLRPEFRAQLPILSPKKSVKADVSPHKPDIPNSIHDTTQKSDVPEQVRSDATSESLTNGVAVINIDSKEVCASDSRVSDVNGVTDVVGANGVTEERPRDAHYFLDLEKKETERLIAMAVAIEKEMDTLQDRNISEEVLGFLRSASGKARLLATQKMQQFEGLCYNNLNQCPGEQFPTTLEDLQGFWDMVGLQVRNVNSLFQHIDQLRANGWREVTPPRSCPPAGTPRAARPTPTPTAAAAAATPRARVAAERREADRRAMLEHRRRIVRERQLAERASADRQRESDTAVEGSQEVEIFVGKGVKPSKVAPEGDSQSGQSTSALDS